MQYKCNTQWLSVSTKPLVDRWTKWYFCTRDDEILTKHRAVDTSSTFLKLAIWIRYINIFWIININVRTFSGVLIYEMLVGYPPFYDDNPFGIYEKILSGKIDWPRQMDPVAKDLVKKLLVPDRTKRLGNMKNGGEDIRRHRWFKNLDWDDVYKRKLTVRRHEIIIIFTKQTEKNQTTL